MLKVGATKFNNEDHHFMVMMPRDLLERTRKMAKRVRLSMGALCREALKAKLDELQAQFDAEEARQEREKAPKKSSRGIGRAPLVPSPNAHPSLIDAEARVTEEPSPLEEVYERQAKHIFAAIDDPTEKRLRVREAIVAVQKQAPLTHPSDSEIIARLERAVLRLQAAAPAKAAEITVDPDRVRSFGDVTD